VLQPRYSAASPVLIQRPGMPPLNSSPIRSITISATRRATASSSSSGIGISSSSATQRGYATSLRSRRPRAPKTRASPRCEALIRLWSQRIDVATDHTGCGYEDPMWPTTTLAVATKALGAFGPDSASRWGRSKRGGPLSRAALVPQWGIHHLRTTRPQPSRTRHRFDGLQCFAAYRADRHQIRHHNVAGLHRSEYNRHPPGQTPLARARALPLALRRIQERAGLGGLATGGPSGHT
jgi:hypothetical protein